MAQDRDIPRHPIRVVALRTGLNPAVLRVWERRYRVVEPHRSEGGQRLYSDADVERLALLHRVTTAGRAIGQAAGLSTAELAALVAEDEAGREQARAVAREPSAGAAAAFVEGAWAAAVALEPARLESALRAALFALGGRGLIEDVVSPLLERVGQAWADGDLTPAHEHAVSAVVRRLLDVVVAGMEAPAGAPSILVATPSGERHEFGALLAAATAAAAGWRVVYLGSDLPGVDIARAAALSGATVVGLSVVYGENVPRVAGEITALARELKNGTKLVVGGRAARSLAPLLETGSAEFVTDLAGLRQFLSVAA